MAEPPYGEIADLLKKGQVVPFLGAGVNFGARPVGATWDDKTQAFLPSGGELSRFLAQKTNFPSQDPHDLSDLAKVSSYFVETNARRRLRDRLHDVFNRDCAVCAIHTFLAEVAATTPLLIVTTNYDDLTERAFQNAGRAYDLVVHPTDRKEIEASVLWWKSGAKDPTPVPPNQLYIDLKTTTVIYKMHGTVDRAENKWDSYVITEDDYVDFLSRMTNFVAVPMLFMRHFRSHSFLFLGYGLQDWNLRVVLKNVENVPTPSGGAGSPEGEAEELRSWAIQRKPSEFEADLWNARHVKVFDVDINEFVQQMRAQG